MKLKTDDPFVPEDIRARSMDCSPCWIMQPTYTVISIAGMTVN